MRAITVKIILILGLVFSISILHGQEGAEQVSIDTSYFKAGDLNYNLLESIAKNSIENTVMLLDRGADPNAVSEIGNTPLMYASGNGNLEMMRLLVETGAEVNVSGYRGETPLFIAIFNNDFQSAKFLLENGADPNVKDDFGVTPLIYAAATNQYQSADLLKFYEADESVRDKEGNDALLAAVTFEHLETTDVLLQNGLDPNVQDSKGNTPLIVATQHGIYDILSLLLEFDADVNIANDKNYTPLAYAITYKDVKASKMLLENGADVHYQIEKGRNMAELARISENDSLINLLAEKGAQLPPGLSFSEFQLSFGNSFNRTDYIISFRGGLVDSKYGYFFETGFDYRPFLLRIQTTVNDTLFQYRERRLGWSHSIGKYFTLHHSGAFKFSAYGSATGYLSFPQYSGTSLDPGVQYSIIPSAGLAITGNYVGLKAGLDWYNFTSTLDKGLKVNVTFLFRISYPEVNYDRKEIDWK